jgi:hypothetical protein
VTAEPNTWLTMMHYEVLLELTLQVATKTAQAVVVVPIYTRVVRARTYAHYAPARATRVMV